MLSNRGQVLAEGLVSWFRGNQRDLPWRRTRDPYRIWVSEIMLQQTRVDTVIPYYERFIERYPTVQALAEAVEADLLKVWEGLGYYSRVRNMHAAAQTVVEQFNGVIPDTREEISKLKGIGPYTAGAILSIAFGKAEPAVDGNVLRVISRYYLLYDDIAKASTRTKVEELVASVIPEDSAGDFNQALMELGALVCTPRSPGCERCPVSSHCGAYLAGEVEQLPIKTKAKKPRYEERATYIIEGTGEREGKIMLRKRPDEGLLAGMWELPHELLAFDMQDQLGLSDYYYMDAEHIFSHIRWQMKVYRCADFEMDKLLGTLGTPDMLGTVKGQIEVQGGKQSELKSKVQSRVQSDGQSENDPRKDMIAAETGWTYAPASASPDDPNNAAVKSARISDEWETIWVSRETWREVALPNVFIRILSQYFDEKDG